MSAAGTVTAYPWPRPQRGEEAWGKADSRTRNGRAGSLKHGVCGRWDGRNLVVPYATYSNWDADMIYGCLCHEGYTGKEEAGWRVRRGLTE